MNNLSNQIQYNNVSRQYRRDCKLENINPNEEYIFTITDPGMIKNHSIIIPNRSYTYDKYFDFDGKEIELTGDPDKDKILMKRSRPKKIDLAYYKGTEPDGGYKFELISLDIDKGHKISIKGRDTHNLALLEYLKLVPMNATNIYSRVVPGRPLFKEEGANRKAKDSILDSLERAEITKMIIEAAGSRIEGWFDQLGLLKLRTIDENKAYLTAWIEIKAQDGTLQNFQKFRTVAPETVLSIKSMIEKAQNLELIRYDRNSASWRLCHIDAVLYETPIGEDHIESLVKFMSFGTDGLTLKGYIDDMILFYQTKQKLENAENIVSKKADKEEDVLEEPLTIREAQEMIERRKPGPKPKL